MRLFSGGNSLAAQGLRGWLWQYRFFVVITIGANLMAAIFEGSTMTLLAIALNAAVGDSTQEVGTSIIAIDNLMASITAKLDTTGIVTFFVATAVLFQLLRSTFEYVGRVAAIYIRAWLEGDLRRQIFRKMMSTSYAHISRYKTGNLASYVEQSTNAGNLAYNLNQSLSDASVAIAYVVVLIWLSWQFTLGAVVALLLLSLGLRAIRKRVHQASTRYMQSSIRLTELILEYLNALRLLNVYVRKDYAIQQVERNVNNSIRARREGLIRNAMIVPIMQIITIFGVGIFLVSGYYLATVHNIGSVGGLAAFVFVLYRLTPRITSLNNHAGSLMNDIPFTERIAQFLHSPAPPPDTRPPITLASLDHDITFRDVSFTYPENREAALSNVSLSILPGQMIAIVGRSGSGKSTIINLLLQLYRPNSGAIYVADLRLENYSADSWREQIGVVDQDPFIFNASVADNIRFGRLDASDAELFAAAQAANAHDFIMELTAGYDTEIGNRGLLLSGGQRQRIAIARAIIRQPRLLIFDEATSALDSEAERQVQIALDNLRHRHTLLVIAHRLSTIAKADRIIVMDKGQVVEQGTHAELLQRQGLYTKLWLL